MARPERYTVQQVQEALQACEGVMKRAAEKLGCDPTHLSRFARNQPEIDAYRRYPLDAYPALGGRSGCRESERTGDLSLSRDSTTPKGPTGRGDLGRKKVGRPPVVLSIM